MSNLDRLREIIRGSACRPSTPGRELTYEPDYGVSVARECDDASRLLNARAVPTPAGDTLVVETRYRLSECHGTAPLHDCVVSADQNFVELAARWNGACAVAVERQETLFDASRNVGFFDLETTGLSGGAGTCAFLVGCGAFEDEAFVVRQFFLSGFGAERALLAAVGEWLNGLDAVVTFNGKTFDLPLIEMRWLFHRMEPPDRRPHLDMLHTARCLWKSRRVEEYEYEEDGGCSLGALERALLGVRRRNDVPGFDIPSRYFHYVRTGDVGPLEPVFSHNRLDILSLAALTARALRLLRAGPSAARDGRECLALGRLLERLGRDGDAKACYAEAACAATDVDSHGRTFHQVARHDDGDVVVEATRRLALLLRRQRNYVDAAVMWQRILDADCVSPALRAEAAEALAVHHEHRQKDLARAKELALDLLSAATARRRDAVEYRLARLDRKLRMPPRPLRRTTRMDWAVQQKSGLSAAPLLDT